MVPSPDVTVEDHQVDGKTILVLHGAPGSAPPYGIAADKGSRDKPEFYVRRGLKYLPCPARRTTRSSPHPPGANVNPGRRIPYGP